MTGNAVSCASVISDTSKIHSVCVCSGNLAEPRVIPEQKVNVSSYKTLQIAIYTSLQS